MIKLGVEIDSHLVELCEGGDWQPICEATERYARFHDISILNAIDTSAPLTADLTNVLLNQSKFLKDNKDASIEIIETIFPKTVESLDHNITVLLVPNSSLCYSPARHYRLRISLRAIAETTC